MVLNSLKIALKTFQRSKLRSSLTIFGIVIGIAMVVIVLSAGAGVKSLILNEISSFGDNWINTEIKVPSAGKTSRENAQGIARGVSITTLNEGDMEAVLELDNIANAYAGITGQVVISKGNEKMRPMVFGVTASYAEITKTPQVEFGRFYTEQENDSAAQVVVIGSEVKDNIFGNKEAVGSLVNIDGKSYQVVGVMESVGSTGFMNMDRIVYIPLSTMQKKILGVKHIIFMIAQTIDNSKAEFTAEEIRWLMRDRHDISTPDKDDFAVTTMNESIEMIGIVITGITWLLIALAAISLLVGGVGIMNVMYVSVVERTFEIGLRKSVGASKRDILMQFLIEAFTVTLIGGIVGVLLGILVSYLVAFGAQYAGLKWEFSVSLFSIVLSTSFSMAVGLIFGIYPAKNASKLDPIEAMRAE